MKNKVENKREQKEVKNKVEVENENESAPTKIKIDQENVDESEKEGEEYETKEDTYRIPPTSQVEALDTPKQSTSNINSYPNKDQEPIKKVVFLLPAQHVDKDSKAWRKLPIPPKMGECKAQTTEANATDEYQRTTSSGT